MHTDVVERLARNAAAHFVSPSHGQTKEALFGGLKGLAGSAFRGMGNVGRTALAHPKTTLGLGTVGAYGGANLATRGIQGLQEKLQDPFAGYGQHMQQYNQQMKPLYDAIGNAQASGNHGLATELLHNAATGNTDFKDTDSRTFLQKVLPNWAGGQDISSDAEMRNNLRSQLQESGAYGSGKLRRFLDPWGSQSSAAENWQKAQGIQQQQQQEYNRLQQQHMNRPAEMERQMQQLSSLGPNLPPHLKKLLDQQRANLSVQSTGPFAYESDKARELAERMRAAEMPLQAYMPQPQQARRPETWDRSPHNQVPQQPWNVGGPPPERFMPQPEAGAGLPPYALPPGSYPEPYPQHLFR